MADYTFAPAPVLIESTGEFAIGATGVLRATEGGVSVQIYDLNNSPMASIVVGPKGAHQAFRADVPHGLLDFGSVLLPTSSLEQQQAGITALNTAQDALLTAEAAQTSALSALNGMLNTAKFIVHGDDPNVARTTAAGVPTVWFGSVQPVNSDAAIDVWVAVSSAT